MKVMLSGVSALSMVSVALIGAVGLPKLSAQVDTQPTTAGLSDTCAGLVGKTFGAGVEIALARTESAGRPIADARAPDMMGMPKAGPPITPKVGFCRVAGTIRPETGSKVNFEVWLPANGWNGRLHGIGNGGFAGAIQYVELAAAVDQGHAAVSTDTGHEGDMLDGAWAKDNPVAIRDFGWRAVHVSTLAAKAIVRAYYGKDATRSYFMSCSNGGRQGLMEAARFPEDYDGILAGAPAWQFPLLMVAMANTVQAQAPTGARLRLEQLKFVQDEVLRQCDGRDGQVDGLVADPRACRVDLSQIECGKNPSKLCLSSPQVTALQRIVDGPPTTGQLAVPGYLLSGGEVGIPQYYGWETWIVGLPGFGSSHARFSQAMLRDFMNGELGAPGTFDFHTGPAKLDAAMSPYLRPSADLTRFFARGGKLIMYHGWSDAAIPAQFTLQYYDKVLRKSGARARDQLRLFMIPGMQHCMGGPGPSQFGQTSTPAADTSPERNIGAALQAWVEQGRRPETLVGERSATGAASQASVGPVRERLLCAWPKKAVLRPGGDPDKGEGYSCR
jgi:feruloyl esterase